jgi:hypothetical protein
MDAPMIPDETEVWLKRRRDACPAFGKAWHALDDALDDYRDHMVTGTPLDYPVRTREEG